MGTQHGSVDSVKERIAAEITGMHPRLIQISHDIHSHPETLFEERYAAALLANELEKEGFTVERGVAGLETAFVATWGQGKPAVGFLAEYDALPKIGHGCGHNLIGTWALGAGIALKRACEGVPRTIKVIGTPAEEGGGGKVTMADAGVFRGLDAAIMMHPRDATLLDRFSLAVTPYTVEFCGKSAHASSFPEKGINALDAVLQVFFSVNALRQSFKAHTRIHGVITHGGDAPNVIPDYAAAKILVRAKDQDTHEEMKSKFLNIVEAAALATAARSKVTEGVSYKARASNQVLVDLFRDNLLALGLDYQVPPTDEGVGSSDIGDVSQIVPAIHPYMAICDRGIPNHTPEFAVASASERADRLLAAGSTVLAWTGADVMLHAEVRERVRASFRQQLGRDPQE